MVVINSIYKERLTDKLNYKNMIVINNIYKERFLNKNLKNFSLRYKILVKIKPTDDYIDNLIAGNDSNSYLFIYNLDNVNYTGFEDFMDTIWIIDCNSLLIKFMFYI